MDSTSITRRGLIVAAPALCVANCGGLAGQAETPGPINAERAARRGRITAAPVKAERSRPDLKRGTRSLGLRRDRDAVLFIPESYSADGPATLIVFLHGAGGRPERALGIISGEVEKRGAIVLAPASQGATWDVLEGQYGPDVAFIDRGLQRVFDEVDVNPKRLTIAGFSDGASYALSLGLMNGKLFPNIIAFSPGFMSPLSQDGRPRVFMSHGDRDPILPIEQCSRVLAPQLRERGCEVDFREFKGGHAVPPEMRQAAFEWLYRSDG